jgi:hypothetical protein
MKELIQTIFATSKERVSNPLIGTFIFSWIAFNWKPIIYILFSNEIIEDKIGFIEKNFTQINNLILFPLFTAFIYVAIIPYINLLIEMLLKYSRTKRNNILILQQKQLIENKKELAIEEIKLEEAQTEFRERKNTNSLLNDLNKSIKDKEEQLAIERKRSEELGRKAKEEATYLRERYNLDQQELEARLKSVLEENNILRSKLKQIDMGFDSTIGENYSGRDINRIQMDDETKIRRSSANLSPAERERLKREGKF